jgi:hypothetical protein
MKRPYNPELHKGSYCRSDVYRISGATPVFGAFHEESYADAIADAYADAFRAGWNAAIDAVDESATWKLQNWEES